MSKFRDWLRQEKANELVNGCNNETINGVSKATLLSAVNKIYDSKNDLEKVVDGLTTGERKTFIKNYLRDGEVVASVLMVLSR